MSDISHNHGILLGITKYSKYLFGSFIVPGNLFENCPVLCR